MKKYKNIKIKPKVTEARAVSRFVPVKMSLREKANIILRISQEGFDYVFRHYSSFNEITDQEFHKLRKQYLWATEALDRYLHRGFSKDQLESLENEEDPFPNEEE
jgi:hypothetical protein